MGLVNLHPVTDVDAIDTAISGSLGKMFYSVDITTLSSVDTSGGVTASSVIQPIYQINVYRYVKYTAAVTYVAGQACSWVDANFLAATNDISAGFGGSGAVAGWFAGCAQAVHTQNSFGYLKVFGRQTGVPCTDTGTAITAGVGLVGHATVDGSVDHHLDTLGTISAALQAQAQRAFAGIALTATASSSCTLFITPHARMF